MNLKSSFATIRDETYWPLKKSKNNKIAAIAQEFSLLFIFFKR